MQNKLQNRISNSEEIILDIEQIESTETVGTASCTATGISGLVDDSQDDSLDSCAEQEKPVDGDIEKCKVTENNSDSTSVRLTVIEGRSG